MHIISGLNVGGAETTLMRLVEPDAVNNSNKDVVVISLTTLGVIGDLLRNKGVTVFTLNMPPSALGFFTALWQLRKLIRQFQPHIVQTWMYHADLLGGLAAYLAGNRNIVWNIRITSVPQKNKLTIIIMRICALLSHWLPKKIICVAEAAKQVHINYGYDGTRMVVIHNGLNFADFTADAKQINDLRQYCRFTMKDTVIGWVGRFHPDKGQENFVKAAAIVKASHPHAKFLLIGKGCDTDNKELMTWLADYDLQHHFVLLGERSDIPICLAAMNIFCMPSSNEGFPNALLEAMAMGLPCVATNVGDASVLAGDTVILVPSQNEHALAQELLKVIIMSKKQHEQMGQRAKEHVLREYSIDRTRMHFDAVYQKMLENE